VSWSASISSLRSSWTLTSPGFERPFTDGGIGVLNRATQIIASPWASRGPIHPLTVSDAENVILALQDEIRRSDESRYDHRLHGLLLVAQGGLVLDYLRGLFRNSSARPR
jgi:hypothetical protein